MQDPSPTLIPPEAGASFWQPVPANGFVRCLLDGASLGSDTNFDLGTQTVDPGCHVREHVHPAQDEVIFILAGGGEALIAGVRHPMTEGTCIYLPKGLRHAFHAPPDRPLTFLWLLMPGGLGTFFARIGRPRAHGEAQPAPFPRPAEILAIEADTVFAPLPPSKKNPPTPRKTTCANQRS